jgi:hypothetical protein
VHRPSTPASPPRKKNPLTTSCNAHSPTGSVCIYSHLSNWLIDWLIDWLIETNLSSTTLLEPSCNDIQTSNLVQKPPGEALGVVLILLAANQHTQDIATLRITIGSKPTTISNRRKSRHVTSRHITSHHTTRIQITKIRETEKDSQKTIYFQNAQAKHKTKQERAPHHHHSSQPFPLSVLPSPSAMGVIAN